MSFIKFSMFFVGMITLGSTGVAIANDAFAGIAIGDSCPTPAIISYLRGAHKTLGVDKLQIEWNTKQKGSIPFRFFNAVYIFNAIPDGNGEIICNYIDGYDNLLMLRPALMQFRFSGNIQRYGDRWKLNNLNSSYFLECTGEYPSACPFDLKSPL